MALPVTTTLHEPGVESRSAACNLRNQMNLVSNIIFNFFAQPQQGGHLVDAG